MPDSPARHHRHRHGKHTHSVMSGWIVRPYDLVIGGLVMRGTYRRIAEAVTRGVLQGGRVLDVGTGPGRLIEAIGRRRPDLTVTGIDPSADMIERARHRTVALPHVTARLAAAEEIPLPDGAVDLVVSTLSSHHWSDPAVAMDEQARVLLPGGRLWLIDLASHLPEGMSEMIEAAGLTLTEEDPGLSGPVGRRLALLSAHKLRAAA